MFEYQKIQKTVPKSFAKPQIAEQLLDLKIKTLKARAKMAKTDEDDERYKIPKL